MFGDPQLVRDDYMRAADTPLPTIAEILLGSAFWKSFKEVDKLEVLKPREWRESLLRRLLRSATGLFIDNFIPVEDTDTNDDFNQTLYGQPPLANPPFFFCFSLTSFSRMTLPSQTC